MHSDEDEKYRTLFESSRDAIYISSREGAILEVNGAASELFGYSRDELIGMDIHSLYADPADRSAFQLEIEGKGSIKDYEVRLCRKGGAVIYCLITAGVRRNREGDILGYHGIIHDITERKKAEEEIKKLNKELERSIAELMDTNRELDAFSHSVSHDLRTPLITIGGFARRLERKYSGLLGDAGKDMVATIIENVRKMERLINDLLAFSRSGRQQMNLVEVDMEELAVTAFEDLRTITPGRKIHFKTAGLHPAYADPSLIRQVVMNLLANAVKFTKTREIATIEVGSRCDGSEIVYFVKDNGVGFDMRHAARLFEVFQRVHGEQGFEGTGIGLSIVQRIITRHGGRCWAEGSVGEGAVFYFTLPRKGSAGQHKNH